MEIAIAQIVENIVTVVVDIDDPELVAGTERPLLVGNVLIDLDVIADGEVPRGKHRDRLS
jgi:hypothetical protein